MASCLIYFGRTLLVSVLIENTFHCLNPKPAKSQKNYHAYILIDLELGHPRNYQARKMGNNFFFWYLTAFGLEPTISNISLKSKLEQ